MHLQDIRKFFGGKPAGSGKSALTEVRNSKGSPVQMKSPNKKHPAAVSQKRSRHLQLSSDSDSENPLPAETRKHLQKSKKPRVIQLSSSDDDLPPSASQRRPQRRGTKISPSPKETDVAEGSKTSSKQNDRDDEVEISDSDEDSSFMPAPPLKKGKRSAAVLPPGQSKLEFSKNIANKAKATSKGRLF
ncbi:unnamed protein product [Anisakis simplex]|uniref:DNA helicase n=1 Tax=Anisakis simplex TaxID=6269 RepID=A0A0M3KF76_ANISI|nr:unnamed protein product [Anisakis simplex]